MIIKAMRTSPSKNLRTPAPAWNQCKSQIRSPISREPTIERCWNFELYLSLCAANERDYKQQHWIETLALPRHNTIRPLSDLHRVRRYNYCCSNTGCVLIEKHVKQNFWHKYYCQSSQNMCDHIFNSCLLAYLHTKVFWQRALEIFAP